MQEHDIIQYCLDALQREGVQKAQGALHHTERHELNVAAGQISLLRTTYDANLQLTGILDQKKGTLSVNSLEQDSLDRSVGEVIALARSSQADPAYDIAKEQAPQVFSAGPEEPERELMYDRLNEFLDYCRQTYPKTILEEITFQCVRTRRCLRNTFGVDFTERQGHYDFFALFTSKDGSQTSSMNYSGFAARQIDQEIRTCGTLDTLLRQSNEQISTKPLPTKGELEVILAPDCVGEFLEYIMALLKDYAIISGTSIFRDKLHEIIATPKLTLHSRPVSDEIAVGYFVTNDGYVAQNSTIIDQGKLQTFLLSLYGAKKTNHARSVNDGGAYVIDEGSTPLERMISSTRKGLLLGRFSGGMPSENGDFSGVAKNSYYIENGEIRFPLSETMISGNLATFLHNIRFISQERIDFGRAILPWIQVSDITASGK